MKPPAPLEKQIQAAVIDRWRVLGVPGSLVCAVPNAGALGQPGLTAGIFDLICIGPLFVGFLELKRESGRLSAHQEAFRLLLLRNGIPHAVAYGLDEAIIALEFWGIIRRAAA